MKKFLSVLLALAMIFSLTVTVSADETKGEMDGYVVVLHTNDVHGAISGYAKVAALKKAYEAEGAYVLLMDAGDFCQGDPTVSVSQGKTAVELMNMAGYDVTTLGNHEFDYGYDNLVNLSKEAKFPIVAANVLYQGKVAFNSNQIFTTPSGVKIGVFGLETPETATKAHPAKIKGVTILGDKSMFDCAQAQVDSLKADASTKPVIVRIALMPMCAASDPSAAMRTNASHTASGDGRRTGAIPPECAASHQAARSAAGMTRPSKGSDERFMSERADRRRLRSYPSKFVGIM